MPYTNALFVAELDDLESRRDLLSHNFVKSILLSTSCLHSLLPPPRDPKLLSRLRAPSKYPRISNRTKLDAGMWRYHANRMDARRSQFDLGRVDAYI